MAAAMGTPGSTASQQEGSLELMARGRPSRQPIYGPLEEAIWDELWHQEAHHSTALEGNTLILNEVRKLLDEGRAVGAKELKEYM